MLPHNVDVFSLIVARTITEQQLIFSVIICKQKLHEYIKLFQEHKTS